MTFVSGYRMIFNLFKLEQIYNSILCTTMVLASTITRGIWKVLSMVFYLSNRFTNPIIFGIILKSYLSSMLWQNFMRLL